MEPKRRWVPVVMVFGGKRIVKRNLLFGKELKTKSSQRVLGRFIAQKNVLYRWKEFLSTIWFFSGFGQWTDDGLGFRITGCWSFSMDLDRPK